MQHAGIVYALERLSCCAPHRLSLWLEALQGYASLHPASGEVCTGWLGGNTAVQRCRHAGWHLGRTAAGQVLEALQHTQLVAQAHGLSCARRPVAVDCLDCHMLPVHPAGRQQDGAET